MSEERHVGDLGNIDVHLSVSVIDIEDTVASLYGDTVSSNTWVLWYTTDVTTTIKRISILFY